jgi:hypothetical protein
MSCRFSRSETLLPRSFFTVVVLGSVICPALRVFLGAKKSAPRGHGKGTAHWHLCMWKTACDGKSVLHRSMQWQS